MPIPDAAISAMAGLSDSALRSLLGLIRLSFRFDPEVGQWVRPERSFSRAAIEAECGLSGQGTRDGLKELESEGYVSIDRTGRSYEHALEIGVPSSRFTYVPTDLFEIAPALSGTELRLVIAVLRATWGWTTDRTETGSGAPEHRRWAQLGVPILSQLTGRSQSAVKQAARELQGTWIQRRRPRGGAYHYRFRTEVLTSERLTTESAPNEGDSRGAKPTVEKKVQGVFSMGVPMDYPPDRQQSGPPRRGTIESFSERPAKHTAGPKRTETAREKPPSPSGDRAVPGGKNPSRGSAGQSAPRSRPKETRPERGSRQGPREGPTNSGGEMDLTGFSGRKRQLGQKLANAGVWPRRIPELLGRYSAGRIEANFQLYRKRADQVRKSGAWLAAAIEGGYALPSPPEGSPPEGSPPERSPPESSGPASSGRASSGRASSGTASSEEGPQQARRPDIADREGAPALPEPGTKVSQRRKEALIRAGQAKREDFDRFRHGGPEEKQHFYRVEKTPSPAART